MRRASLAAALALLALLAFPAVAEACNGWSEPDMETQLMCPTCHQVLAYSQSEIADRLGLPLGTVKKRVKLGMDKLRGALAGEKWADLV